MASYNKIIVITAPSGEEDVHHRFLLQKFAAFPFPLLPDSPGSMKRRCRLLFSGLEDFKEKIRNKEFAEWEMVYEGKYYGTLKSELQRIWNRQQVPLLDIDVKELIHVKQQALNRCSPSLLSPRRLPN